jgi:DeoR/GlpR family transcriptional regulator of sugar metabolism
MEMIARIRADAFYMGVTGIHPKMGLTTGDAEETTIKRALSRQAAETIALAPSEAQRGFPVLGYRPWRGR